MFLHAKALEIYAHVYESLAALDFEAEFADADRTQLKEIMAQQQIDSTAGPKPTTSASP